MLKWAIIFFIVSVVAGLLGFTNIAVGSAAISKVLFFVSLLLFLTFVVAAMVVGKAVSGK